MNIKYKLAVTAFFGMLVGVALTYQYTSSWYEERENIIYLGIKRNALMELIEITENGMENPRYTDRDRLNCKVRSLYADLRYELEKNTDSLKDFFHEGVSAYENISEDLIDAENFINTKLGERCPLVQS